MFLSILMFQDYSREWVHKGRVQAVQTGCVQ